MYAEECRQSLESNLGVLGVVCLECGDEALAAIKADEGGETGTVQCDGCQKRFRWDGEMLVALRARKG